MFAVTTVGPAGETLSAETENKKQLLTMKERGVERDAEGGRGGEGRKDGRKDVVAVRQCWLSNRCHCQCLPVLTAHDQIFS